jgi:hypothetical protein
MPGALATTLRTNNSSARRHDQILDHDGPKPNLDFPTIVSDDCERRQDRRQDQRQDRRLRLTNATENRREWQTLNHYRRIDRDRKRPKDTAIQTRYSLEVSILPMEQRMTRGRTRVRSTSKSWWFESVLERMVETEGTTIQR